MEENLKQLVLVAVISPIIPLIIGIVKYRKLNLANRYIFFLATCDFGVSIYSSYQNRILHTNNMPSLHLLTVLEVLFITLFFTTQAIHKKSKILIYLVGASFIVYSILNSIFIQDIETFNSYARGLEAFIIISFSINYFYKRIQVKDLSGFINSSYFYFGIAFLFYYGSAQILYLFQNLIYNKLSGLFMIYYMAHALVCTIYYSLLGYGLWKNQ